MSLFTHLVLADSGLGGQPDPNGLPGSSALQQLISGLAFWALLASLAGLFISAAVWAMNVLIEDLRRRQRAAGQTKRSRNG